MLRFACDTGGTFTDLIVEDKTGSLSMYKAATTPDDPIVGAINALRLAAEDRGLGLSDLLKEGEMFIHGTTHAINAIITGNTAKTGFFTTLLYKLFIKVKSANLINIITNRQDVPEFLFERCTPLNIFKESKKILTDKSYAEKQLMASREAIRSLGYGSLHPATRAAKSVLNHLKIN